MKKKLIIKSILGSIPFILLIILYLSFANLRHVQNSNDKIVPLPKKMWESIERSLFIKDVHTGKRLLIEDTRVSLLRIGIGISFAAFLGLFIGLFLGLFKLVNNVFSPFIRFLSIIPPLSVLPILFIIFGVDEFGKIALIFLGAFFVITRSISRTVTELPVQQITKSLTLGANKFRLAFVIVLPQILPKLIIAIRLILPAAWLFLITAEAISSTSGLGYRIFLVRRYLDMATIIPYVLWMTFLGFLIDFFLKKLTSIAFTWYSGEKL
ncbi:MAG: ABC transporter permease subunit [Spirochaetes bacterium]|nr:ABC transporter permease subunit [Spirochaetota bacterium]